jgi:hypothetical protein
MLPDTVLCGVFFTINLTHPTASPVSADSVAVPSWTPDRKGKAGGLATSDNVMHKEFSVHER